MRGTRFLLVGAAASVFLFRGTRFFFRRQLGFYRRAAAAAMGIDLVAGGKSKKTKRTAPKSDDIYLKLIVKLYRFLVDSFYERKGKQDCGACRNGDG